MPTVLLYWKLNSCGINLQLSIENNGVEDKSLSTHDESASCFYEGKKVYKDDEEIFAH